MQDPNLLIKDLIKVNTNNTTEFKLDYLIYSENLEEIKKHNRVIFNNSKYVIVETD